MTTIDTDQVAGELIAAATDGGYVTAADLAARLVAVTAECLPGWQFGPVTAWGLVRDGARYGSLAGHRDPATGELLVDRASADEYVADMVASCTVEDAA